MRDAVECLYQRSLGTERSLLGVRWATIFAATVFTWLAIDDPRTQRVAWALCLVVGLYNLATHVLLFKFGQKSGPWHLAWYRATVPIANGLAAIAAIYVTGGPDSWAQPVLTLVLVTTMIRLPNYQGLATGIGLIAGKAAALAMYSGAWDVSLLADSAFHVILLFTVRAIARQEAGYRISSRALQQLLASLPCGVAVVDQRGVLRLLNDAGANILGIEKDSWIGRPLSHLGKAAGFIYAQERVAASEPAGHAGWASKTYVGIPTAAGEKALLATGTPMLLGGEPVVVTAFVDITVEHRLQLELRKSEHLALLGEIAAGTAHEIRNPLAAMRANAQLALFSANPEKKDVNLQRVISEIDRLNGMLSDLLFLASPPSRERRPLRVRQLIDDVLVHVQERMLVQGIQVHVDAAEGLHVWAFEGLLKQALLHVVVNAIDAMPSGGGLFIQASEHPDGVLLSIRDTGEGIPKERREQLFTPLFRAKPGRELALGLPIAREIVVERHNGRIWFESEVGRGTTFFLLVPDTERDEATAPGAGLNTPGEPVSPSRGRPA